MNHKPVPCMYGVLSREIMAVLIHCRSY